MTLAELTSAQQKALEMLGRPSTDWPLIGGELTSFAHAGVQPKTVDKLVDLGMARWTDKPHQVTNYGLKGKRRYSIEWAAVITWSGMQLLAECKEH